MPSRLLVPVNPPPSAPRVAHALPLANERSEHEQELQLVQELEELAARLELANPGSKATPPLVAISDLRRASWGNTGESAEAGAWNQISETFYQWDASIQDALLMLPARAAAYQLGRGLAETYLGVGPNHR